MPELQLLRADHAAAVLAFELANRAWFATFISDRGDAFYDRFAEQHDGMLAEQQVGTCAFYVLVEADGSVVGRFNLYAIADGTAEVGYRVAQQVSGRGVATAAVKELARLAADRHGMRLLKAQCTDGNAPSSRVLLKAGFTAVGPTDIHGLPATWYERHLNGN